MLEIQNTKLYNELLELYPEYYYGHVEVSYFEHINNKWREVLKSHEVEFSPTSYHYNRKKDYIELETKKVMGKRDSIRVSKSPMTFKLKE